MKRLLVLLVAVFIASGGFYVGQANAKTISGKISGKLFCSLKMSEFIQHINKLKPKTGDFYILRNTESVLSNRFGSLNFLFRNKIRKQAQFSQSANWNTLAFSIYDILKQDKKNALYMLFLIDPFTKKTLAWATKKNKWCCIESGDVMYVSFLINHVEKAVFNKQDMPMLANLAFAYTFYIASSLKNAEGVDTKILEKTVYALLSKNPEKEIRYVYYHYIPRNFEGFRENGREVGPIKYCGMFLGK